MKSARTRKLIELGLLLITDTLFFSLTNPRSMPALLIIVGFLLLVITIYSIVSLLLLVAERIVPFSVRTKKRMSLAVTIVSGLLLAMQSIGQLTVKDILTFIPIVIVLAFYFSYVTSAKNAKKQ